MSETLNFTIEPRSTLQVLVWDDGSCRPADATEVAMWSRLAMLEEALSEIVRLETCGANATVRKMANIARTLLTNKVSSNDPE